MKLRTVLIAMAMTIPAVWGQSFPKHPAGVPSLHIRSMKSHARLAKPKAAPAAAPVVVVATVDPASGTIAAYAVVTATIPSGTGITGGITLDDGSTIDFDQVAFSSDLNPGDTITLPSITNYFNVWGQDTLDYTVQIIPGRGATLQADGIASIGQVSQYSDLTGLTPLISSVAESINSGKDVILAIKGQFSGDPVSVLIGDLFSNNLAPSSAVTVSATEIDVDLSKLAGFDCDPNTGGSCLAFVDDLVVTVNQDNISDTVRYRHLPAAPGSYNPAPSGQ